jgi:hypothetical protein
VTLIGSSWKNFYQTFNAMYVCKVITHSTFLNVCGPLFEEINGLTVCPTKRLVFSKQDKKIDFLSIDPWWWILAASMASFKFCPIMRCRIATMEIPEMIRGPPDAPMTSKIFCKTIHSRVNILITICAIF